jgi:predicted  nucleic acid-binding Zn-ribbon protein
MKRQMEVNMKNTKTKTRKRTRATAAKVKSKRRTRVATRHGVLDIENGLGRMKTPRAIAKTLKRAADASEDLTSAPFHAAMAALDHLIHFLDRQRARLEAARVELQKLYGESVDEPPRVRARTTSGARAARGTGSRSRKRVELAAPLRIPFKKLLPT